MKAVAIIPARYESTRFPGKALAKLLNKPLIQWVWEAVNNAELFDQVLVATDSILIKEAVDNFGGQAVLTRKEHQSGTDRIAEVAESLDCDIIVNVQGDEPLINQKVLSPLLQVMKDTSLPIASLMTPIKDFSLLSNPNLVKVVVDNDSNALYFSRSAIPFNRDNIPLVDYWQHIGVYAYRRNALMQLVKLPSGKLEQVEKLEQLRALEHGIPIRMVTTEYNGIGVDTPEDLLILESLLKEMDYEA
ncbi:MAG: 3-deoxy-manno-octulosonate cytidylyltransferase [Candidatus Cloacimonadaceae bacterium]|jgi:3-deoxy-manno-octulosonate cytidylyltransferase (CMP-KDO synthetase)|nr:3-deoxy-manno-octulosonate cytidylyltransferase [Candidatus Syntrophosphaera sp.]